MSNDPLLGAFLASFQRNIGPGTFTVNQSGAPSCTYVIDPQWSNRSADAGTGMIAVTTDASCSWQASSNAAWLHITGGTSATGSGAVSYSVEANPSTSSRSGTMTIAGKTFTVNQSGGTSCTYAISPTFVNLTASGGTGFVSIETGDPCTWLATSNASWVSITSGHTGVGSGNVQYEVQANTATAPRTGTMALAGRTFTINQEAGAGEEQDLSYHVGGIARAPGVGGTTWRSSLTLHNPGDAVAHIDLTYSYGDTQRTATVNLEPGATRCWLDVANELFYIDQTATGALHLEADQSIVITPRTYNDTPNGTYGQLMPVHTADDALDPDTTGIIGDIRKNAQFRTNIGYVNLTDATCNVRFEIVNHNGSAIGSRVNTTIPPNASVQRNNVAGLAGIATVDVASATLQVTTPGCRVLAFGSMIDNTSGDPTTVPVVVR